MSVIRVSEKAPTEIVPLSFDFEKLVTGIDSGTIVATVQTGTDPDVGTMLVGSESITGTKITQLIQNGLDGVIYLVRADIVSGGENYSLVMELPVKEIG